MEGRRGAASMSRGHQTGQARIATTAGPGDLQRVTRREFNRAGSNEAGTIHRRSFTLLRLSYPSDNNEIMRRKCRSPPRPSLILEPCTTNFCVYHAKRRGGDRDPMKLPTLWEVPDILSHRVNQCTRGFQGARALQPLENGATL